MESRSKTYPNGTKKTVRFSGDGKRKIIKWSARGRVTGRLVLYWAPTLAMFVSIPGAESNS